jgi:hypothetical protein
MDQKAATSTAATQQTAPEVVAAISFARNRKFVDSPLEEAVSSEPVSETRNSLLAGKIQGNSGIM